MKKFLLIGALTLGGCATTGGTVDINATIAAVQSATVAACKFLPTVSTVASLLTTGNAIVQTVDVLAAAICQAVAPAAVSANLRAKLRAPGPTPIVVNGVIIHGKFVS